MQVHGKVMAHLYERVWSSGEEELPHGKATDARLRRRAVLGCWVGRKKTPGL